VPGGLPFMRWCYSIDVMRHQKTTGETIRQARLAGGWSQSELAALIGVRQETVSGWETDRMRPAVESAICLAELLGLDDWLKFRRVFKRAN
jgi:transcriptional regulator with XRE-family HTH domain